MIERTITALAVALTVAACSGDQSILDPRGRHAEAIANHWWFFFAVCTAVYAIVIAVMFWVFFRRNRPRDRSSRDRNVGIAVTIGAGATSVIVLILLLHAIWTGRELQAAPTPDQLHIEVVGHQFWWDVQYKRGETTFLRTANEIHLPVGEPVHVNVTSRDVIHSFWVPNLHGKIDLIPGKKNSIALHVERAGVYRGQCAEFCGMQHALMGMLVIAQPRDEFSRWLEQQQQPAREPTTDEQRRGRDVLVSTQCAVCHTVRGTMARGTTAPDLTHLASRRTIAAATLPNTRGHLAGWVLDPQSVKPGNLMPPSQYEADDFQALISYLESLQ